MPLKKEFLHSVRQLAAGGQHDGSRAPCIIKTILKLMALFLYLMLRNTYNVASLLPHFDAVSFQL